MKRSVVALCAFAILSLFIVRPLYALPLTIKRIELYFENNRPEITVEKDHRNLNAFAKVTFASSGLLEGYWEVDGRILSRVNMHLTKGNTVLLKTPDTLQLPTFDPGTHVVKFVITNPLEKALPTPMMLYFVTAQEGGQRSRTTLKTVAPQDGVSLKYEPMTFIWEKLANNPTYIIQFHTDPSSTPFYSACTMNTTYELSGSLLRNMFKAGTRYYWKVKGGSDKEEAESSLKEFRFTTAK